MYRRGNIQHVLSQSKASGITLSKLVKYYGVIGLCDDYGIENVHRGLLDHYGGNNPSRFVNEYKDSLRHFAHLIHAEESALVERSSAVLQLLLSYEEE